MASKCAPKATCRGTISPSDRPKSIPADAIDRSADRWLAPTGPRPTRSEEHGPYRRGTRLDRLDEVPEPIVEQRIHLVVEEADQLALGRVDGGTDRDRVIRIRRDLDVSSRDRARRRRLPLRGEAVGDDHQLDWPISGSVERPEMASDRISRPGDDDHRHERPGRDGRDRDRRSCPPRKAGPSPRQRPKPLASRDGETAVDPPTNRAGSGDAHPSDRIPRRRRPSRRHRSAR